MKKYLLVMLCLCIHNCWSQLAYDNVFSIGNTGDDETYSVCSDVNGNYYITGTFMFWIDIDPGTGSQYLTSNGGFDIYVAKFNSAGVLQWAFSIGGTGDDWVGEIETDMNSNVFICGEFESVIDFDHTSGINTATPQGAFDGFLVKYNNAGNCLWANIWGGQEDEAAYGLSYDPGTNSIRVAGSFESDSIDMDPNATYMIVNQNTQPFTTGDIYVANYNAANGSLNWTFGIGGGQGEDVYAIESDNAGNLILTGSIGSANVDFNPGTNTDLLSTAGSADAFVAKYNNQGVHQWAVRTGSNYGDIGFSITVDNNNNVYAGGYFNSDSVDFDPGAGTHYHATNGVQDLYVLKLDPSGQYIWSFSCGGFNSEVTQNIDVDDNGNLFITGNFGDTVDFDPGPGVASVTGNSTSDAYIAQYNSNGDFVDVVPYSGDGYEFGIGLCILPGNKIVATGFFSTGTIDVDPGSGVHIISNTGGNITWVDGFVSTYSYSSTGIDESSNLHFQAFPNPANDAVRIIHSIKDRDADVTIADVSGKIIYNERLNDEEIDVSQFVNGIYFIHLAGENISTVQKLIIQH